MSWTYSITTGRLSSEDGKVAATGYSGHGEGLNNRRMQSAKGVGPIPAGRYAISPAFDHPEKGPCVMRLTPHPDNIMYGRSGFMLHGDNPAMNHTASDGCIIQGHDTREAVSASDDKELVVIS